MFLSHVHELHLVAICILSFILAPSLIFYLEDKTLVLSIERIKGDNKIILCVFILPPIL